VEIKKVVVVGSGTMGAGIGQLCAQKGFAVTVTDIAQELVDKAAARIEKGLDKRIAKGKISEDDKRAVLDKMHFAVGNEAAREADFVIESVVEDLDIKKKVFAELDGLVRPEVVMATNTTSLSISAVAEATGRPEKVVQMHFFNPPVVMKLVEIMPGQKTAPETLQAAAAFAESLGKDPVVCEAEAPAGIVSRVLGQLLNEATWLVQTGVAKPADIDKAMKLGAGHPMGPLQLVDMIGLDVHRAKMQTLRRVLDDPRYAHPPVVDELVEQGKLGKKSGHGFYDYDG
jgi:3-hydroxybutyryl-CoA dehydrogenase